MNTLPRNRLPVSPPRQAGAVTVIMVLIIVLIITTMVLVLLDASTSQSTDTAAQNDSVEALFLAESGLERTSWRYVSGSVACASLAPEGPTSFGRGSFTVDSADTLDFDGTTTLPTGQCHVKITGTVNNAKRTVEAIIQLPSGGGMVVGNGGTILQCGSSGCTAVTSPTTRTLNAVYCINASDCLVGGDAVLYRWNGSSWYAYYNYPSGYFSINDISCEPNNGNNCVAVGRLFYSPYSVLLGVWDGSTWSWTEYEIFGAFGAEATGASCGSAICRVVTNGGYAFFHDGGGWSYESSPVNSLNGVACWSSNDCWAVANANRNRFEFSERTGGGWSPLSLRSPSDNANLNAVTCFSGSDCWAVGDHHGNQFTFVYWDGSNWTPMPLVDTTNRNDLNGVDCRLADDCLAVGANGEVLHWDGSAWTLVSAGTVTTNTLNDVSMPDTGGGGGGGGRTLIKWHEIVAQ